MNPRKYYVLEAVSYQEKEKGRNARFALAGSYEWDVDVPQGKPETLRVVIPSGVYDSTCIDLDIRNLHGSSVTLASLKLYEFEIVRRGGRELAGVEQVEPAARLSAVTLTPNPFSRRLTVSYSLSRPTNVSIDVYDASGKIARSLVSERQNQGNHAVLLDAGCGPGRHLAAGLYFVRLVADGVPDTRKIVLTR